jgi:cytosine deaminase
MLVLARQRDQTVMIGDDIEVTVVDIRGDKVRLGVNAPRTVSVHRKEVYEAIRRENQSAAHMKPGDLPAMGDTSGPAGRIAPADSADPFLPAALEEARAGAAAGGLPIGAVLVRDGQIIARSHDERVQSGDPTAFAELRCLMQAGKHGSLAGATLYTTLMPGHLVAGAVVQFGLAKVVAGESVTAAGAAEFLRRHKVEVIDLHHAGSIEMVRKSQSDHPERWAGR